MPKKVIQVLEVVCVLSTELPLLVTLTERAFQVILLSRIRVQLNYTFAAECVLARKLKWVMQEVHAYTTTNFVINESLKFA
jgi:hypothetical protein